MFTVCRYIRTFARRLCYGVITCDRQRKLTGAAETEKDRGNDCDY